VAEARGYYDSGAREFTCVGVVPAVADDRSKMT